MQYHQITSGERYAIAALRRQGLSSRAIARDLGRAPSTISREVRAQPPRRRRLPRLHRLRAHAREAPALAPQQPLRRRGVDRWSSSSSRLDWSPEQVAGWLRPPRAARDQLRDDLPPRLARQARRRASCGGTCARRARSGANATAPTTPAAGSPASATSRSGRRRSRRAQVVGHWEIDTVMGNEHGRNSVVTMVERATGYRSWASSRATAPPTRRRAASS